MSTNASTFFCILFVLGLFFLDKEAKKYSSISLWVPLIWVLVISSRSVSYWFTSAGDEILNFEIEEGNPIDRLFYLSVEFMGVLILFKRKFWRHNFIRNNAIIFLFYSYCGLSILWSDFPFVSLKRLIKSMGSLIMVFIIWTEPYPLESIKIIFKRCAYILLPASIVIYKYHGHLGRKFNPFDGAMMVTGVTIHKNSLGYLCMILGLFIIWYLTSYLVDKQYQLPKIELFIQSILLIMMFYLIFLSRSATSQMCLLLGTGLLIASTFRTFRTRIVSLSSIIIIAIIGIAVLEYALGLSETVIMMLGRDATFTGRTVLWDIVLNMSENKIIGTGFHSFWLGTRLDELWELYWWQPKQSHNGYIEIYINLGFVGLGLLFLVFLSIFKQTVSGEGNKYNLSRLQLSLLVVVLLYNITESTFAGMNLIWFTILLLAVRPAQPTGDREKS